MEQSKQDFLASIAELPTPEKAAAIAHRIYALTAGRCGWTTRVPERWTALDSSAREYNMATVDTWVEEIELFERWVHALLELRVAARSR